MSLVTDEQKSFFEAEGYLIVENLIDQNEVNYYSSLYNSFLDNSIDASRFRSDLSGNTDKKEKSPK